MKQNQRPPGSLPDGLPSLPLPMSNEGEQLARKIDRLAEGKPTRRERIATAALQGLLSTHAATSYEDRWANEELAREALGLADALIAELDREDGE